MRRGGTIFFSVDGERFDAKGNFSYNLGAPKRDTIHGADGVHGYKETIQAAFIEGEITDRGDLSLDRLVRMTGVTVTLELANGKVIVLRDAWFAGDGTGTTEEGAIQVRFEGPSPAEEIAAS